MNNKAIRILDLRHIEGCFFFAAMLLAIVLEGACVYRLGAPTLQLHSGEPGALVVEWTACTLPQYWLLGALAVLLYRIVFMVVPPRGWGQSESQNNRSAFVRLWRWTVAIGTVQMAVLYLDRISLGVR